MDPLYKIIKQLSEDEFEVIYQNLTSNKAEKSALFLKTIRESENPVEDFLEKQDISASAFYVLKSRLNQKVENFLLNRLGDPKMEAIHKVFKVYDLIFQSPREIAITTLKRLEKTMIEIDNPLVLMVVYRALKMLYNNSDNERVEYDKLYNQAVAFYLTSDKAMEAVMTFFRGWDKYYLGRKEKDFNDLIKTIEKVANMANLYESQRLFICKAIVHLFASLHLNLPDRVTEIMDNPDEAFEKAFQVLERGEEDILFKNINLIFDYLRFSYYNKAGFVERANIYFGVLDSKIEELLTNFNLGMDCSQILFHKLERHLAVQDLNGLIADNENYIAHIEVEPYRVITYVNFNLFQAYVSYYDHKYEEVSRILYRLRNKVNLRKFPHIDVEVKMFLAFSYVLQDEADLANQLILSLQRQVKKENFEDDYENARLFIKVMTNRLSGKTTKRVQQVRRYLDEFRAANVGEHRFLPYLDLDFSLFPNH